ncbi:MAG TPA: hypothetical protein VGR93_13095 [Candidatus Acidoferrales bacterium]|nr:hypothetical protein [Candidatus Acidoferrales bacterium]
MTDEFAAATTTAPSLASYHEIENVRGAPRDYCAPKRRADKPLIPITAAASPWLAFLSDSVALGLSQLLSILSGSLLRARRESAYFRDAFVLGLFVERYRPPLY